MKKKVLKVLKLLKGEYFYSMFYDNDYFYVFLWFVFRLRRVGCLDKLMKLFYFKYMLIEVIKDEIVFFEFVFKLVNDI